jgi:hypothetical protein
MNFHDLMHMRQLPLLASTDTQTLLMYAEDMLQRLKVLLLYWIAVLDILGRLSFSADWITSLV